MAEYGEPTTTPKGRIHHWAVGRRKHRPHGNPNHPKGVGKWNAENAFRFPKPLTTSHSFHIIDGFSAISVTVDACA
jgi:hypothetical protein